MNGNIGGEADFRGVLCEGPVSCVGKQKLLALWVHRWQKTTYSFAIAEYYFLEPAKCTIPPLV